MNCSLTWLFRCNLCCNTTFTSAVAAGVLLSAPAPAQAQTANLSNISQQVFACMQRNLTAPGGRISYSGGNAGQIKVFTGSIQVGAVNYRFDASQKTLTLNFVSGPATLLQVRDGLSQTAARCRSNSGR